MVAASHCQQVAFILERTQKEGRFVRMPLRWFGTGVTEASTRVPYKNNHGGFFHCCASWSCTWFDRSFFLYSVRRLSGNGLPVEIRKPRGICRLLSGEGGFFP